ncbi:MAG: DNA-directed RNA polymerase subunit alpha [Patescibacteria group bacterium]
MSYSIILPSKPKIVVEKDSKGVYEIDGLYPGYGHTLGNSLRRIILSSLPGAAITAVKIDGVAHEFSTIDGVKEDVITILLNLKQLRFRLSSDEPQKATIKVSGVKTVTGADLKIPGQVELTNPELEICHVTDKGTTLEMEITIEKGLGYVPKEVHAKEKVEVGMIAVDAIFTPIRRVNYEVENMRVGDRTDYNRLRISIETDGIISPREALESSVALMIDQLRAIVGFREEEVVVSAPMADKEEISDSKDKESTDEDALKTRIEDLGFSARTLNALTAASIRTVGGLARKREEDLLEIAGMGEKGIGEIKRVLSNFGITLK